jgi:hypothetical protein
MNVAKPDCSYCVGARYWRRKRFRLMLDNTSGACENLAKGLPSY